MFLKNDLKYVTYVKVTSKWGQLLIEYVQPKFLFIFKSPILYQFFRRLFFIPDSGGTQFMIQKLYRSPEMADLALCLEKMLCLRFPHVWKERKTRQQQGRSQWVEQTHCWGCCLQPGGGTGVVSLTFQELHVSAHSF